MFREGARNVGGGGEGGVGGDGGGGEDGSWEATAAAAGKPSPQPS